jgi:hypothetical protein
MVLHVGLGRQRRSVQIVARVLHWKNNHRWQSDKAQAETHIMQAREVGGPAWHVARGPACGQARCVALAHARTTL